MVMNDISVSRCCPESERKRRGQWNRHGDAETRDFGYLGIVMIFMSTESLRLRCQYTCGIRLRQSLGDVLDDTLDATDLGIIELVHLKNVHQFRKCS